MLVFRKIWNTYQMNDPKAILNLGKNIPHFKLKQNFFTMREVVLDVEV